MTQPNKQPTKRQIIEMVTGRIWAVHDTQWPEGDRRRITFHYTAEAAKHHKDHA